MKCVNRKGRFATCCSAHYMTHLHSDGRFGLASILDSIKCLLDRSAKGFTVCRNCCRSLIDWCFYWGYHLAQQFCDFYINNLAWFRLKQDRVTLSWTSPLLFAQQNFDFTPMIIWNFPFCLLMFGFSLYHVFTNCCCVNCRSLGASEMNQGKQRHITLIPSIRLNTILWTPSVSFTVSQWHVRKVAVYFNCYEIYILNLHCLTEKLYGLTESRY
jgi:hypothetical protein